MAEVWVLIVLFTGSIRFDTYAMTSQQVPMLSREACVKAMETYSRSSCINRETGEVIWPKAKP